MLSAACAFELTEADVVAFAATARKALIAHGMVAPSKMPTYGVWMGARSRCTRPTNPSYRKYGARGITMCESWRTSFANFLADMGERPPGTSLDRIDGTRGYEPGNCRWATPLEQTLNQPNRRRFEWQGEMLSLSEVAAKVGLDYQFLRYRIKRGVSLADAISTPHRSSKARLRKLQTTNAHEGESKKTRRVGFAGKLPERAGWFEVLAAEPSNVKAAALLGTTIKTIEHFRRRYVRAASVSPAGAGKGVRNG